MSEKSFDGLWPGEPPRTKKDWKLANLRNQQVLLDIETSEIQIRANRSRKPLPAEGVARMAKISAEKQQLQNQISLTIDPTFKSSIEPSAKG